MSIELIIFAIVVVGGVLAYSIVHLRKIGLYCPKCYKWFAGRITRKEVVRPHDGYSWADGYFLECRYCGHQWKRVVEHLERWDV